MPYIKEYLRRELDFPLPKPFEAGQLNYLISRLVNDYVYEQGKSYETLNEVVGVLECAKLEVYRKVAAPYEDEKCKANGEVYTV